MRNYCKHRELHSILCGDLNGKETQKEGIYVYIFTDSYCCTAETNTTV